MPKLSLINLIIISTNCLASEPANDPKPSSPTPICPHSAINIYETGKPQEIRKLQKCLNRELAVHAGEQILSWSETLFGSGCYKWIAGPRDQVTSLIRKCHQDNEFAALLARKYCEKKTKI